MTTSSNGLVYAVLITLFLAVVPLNNTPELLRDEVTVQPAGGVLEDYELYFDDDTTLTTIEPSGSYDETSLLGSGVVFDTDELISDLTIEGKTSSEVRIFVYMKFESSNKFERKSSQV